MTGSQDDPAGLARVAARVREFWWPIRNGYLFDADPRLPEAERLLVAEPNHFNGIEHAFVLESRAARERLERAGRRRVRAFVCAVSLLAFAALVAGSIARDQRDIARAERDEAERRRKLAEAGELAARSSSIGPERDMALLLAASAFQLASTFDSRRALFSRLAVDPHLVRVFPATGPRTAFTADRCCLITEEREVRYTVNEIVSGKILRSIPIRGPGPNSGISRDGTTVYDPTDFDTLSNVWSVLVSDVVTGDSVGRFPVQVREYLEEELVFAPLPPARGRYLYAVRDSNGVALWDVGRREVAKHLPWQGSTIVKLESTRDGSLILGTTEDNAAVAWNTTTYRRVHVPATHTPPIQMQSSDDGRVRFRDPASGALLSHWPGLRANPAEIALAPVGRRLASYHGQALTGVIGVWDFNDTTLSAHTPAPHAKVLGDYRNVGVARLENGARANSPDGSLIARQNASRAIVLIDRTTRQAVDSLLGLNDRVYAIAFSADGRTVGAVESEAVRIWRRGAIQPVAQFRAGLSPEMAISPDGGLAAFIGGGHPLQVVDVAAGRILGEVPRTGESMVPGPLVDRFAFVEQGRRLEIVYTDGSVERISMDPALWSARACSIAQTDLARDRWQQYAPRGVPYPGHRCRKTGSAHHLAGIRKTP